MLSPLKGFIETLISMVIGSGSLVSDVMRFTFGMTFPKY